jgi:hypothetical protein
VATLADQGIDLRLWAPTKAVHRDAGGGIVVSFADGSQVGGNELLVAEWMIIYGNPSGN